MECAEKTVFPGLGTLRKSGNLILRGEDDSRMNTYKSQDQKDGGRVYTGSHPASTWKSRVKISSSNAVGLGLGKKYSRMPVGPGAYMFPAWDMNHSYEENDIFVTSGKMKNHGVAGITLSMKNLFGCLPLSIYGGDAGVDEPNEHPTANRAAVGHTGTRAPSKCSPGELNFGANHDGGSRMPRIVVDLVVARPVHLAIIDGIESIAGSELPRNVNLTKPNVLLAGFNPVPLRN
jgi:hypothetical protein